MEVNKTGSADVYADYMSCGINMENEFKCMCGCQLSVGVANNITDTENEEILDFESIDIRESQEHDVYFFCKECESEYVLPVALKLTLCITYDPNKLKLKEVT